MSINPIKGNFFNDPTANPLAQKIIQTEKNPDSREAGINAVDKVKNRVGEAAAQINQQRAVYDFSAMNPGKAGKNDFKDVLGDLKAEKQARSWEA